MTLQQIDTRRLFSKRTRVGPKRMTSARHGARGCQEYQVGITNASVHRRSESAWVTRRLRRLMTRCTTVSLSRRANMCFKSNGAHAIASYRVATVFATDRWTHLIHCANSRCLVLSVAFIRRVVRAYCFLVRRYFGPRVCGAHATNCVAQSATAIAAFGAIVASCARAARAGTAQTHRP